MPSSRRAMWRMVGRLSLVVSTVAALVVLAGGLGLWAVERDSPGSTLRSPGDGLWWALTTLTTVGYGDQVPVSAAGRVIAGGVMVAGVAVIGAVAAVVALAVAARVAATEEELLEGEAEALEQRLESRLARLEGKLDEVLGARTAGGPAGHAPPAGAHARPPDGTPYAERNSSTT